MDALPTEVADLQAQLRLSRAQCADFHRQLQGMVPASALTLDAQALAQETATLRAQLALTREQCRLLRDEDRAQLDAALKQLTPPTR
jgi:hypothetical protein